MAPRRTGRPARAELRPGHGRHPQMRLAAPRAGTQEWHGRANRGGV